MRDEEVLLPFEGSRESPPPATHVRGTTILSSQRSLRARGLFDRYVEQIPAPHRETLLAVTAQTWQPVELALVHYAACDRLALPREKVLEIGAESGRFLNQTVLSTVFSLSREIGASPWTAIPHVNRLIGRTWRGSTGGVFKLGPKECRLEWIGQPAASIPYFRVAFGGFIQGVFSVFARTVYVRELPRCCTVTTLGYRCAWV
jgi:hypothetical protein